jgi:methionyl-tRNA formyltransferase
LTTKILNKNIRPIFQNEKKTIFKRRKPTESQITISELKNKDANYLYNKIRMLTNPYPNAFIKTKDGKKLFILETKVGNK